MADKERLTCANGSPWGRYGCGDRRRPCAKCRRESDAACRAFDRRVFFGDYDSRGYTPAEARERDRHAGDALPAERGKQTNSRHEVDAMFATRRYADGGATKRQHVARRTLIETDRQWDDVVALTTPARRATNRLRRFVD